MVLIDRKMEQTDCDCVLVDNKGAAEEAVERLFAAGHRKIGIIAGPDKIYTAKERLSGYRKAFYGKGMTPGEEFIARGDYTIAGGARAMRELMEKNKEMTAVFISNYEMTVGAMMELNDLGVSVPEELSVIGFDNEDFARALRPRLSIVTQPRGEIARRAAELLLGRLERETAAKQPGNLESERPETVTLKTGFVEGRSVKYL